MRAASGLMDLAAIAELFPGGTRCACLMLRIALHVLVLSWRSKGKGVRGKRLKAPDQKPR